MTNSDIFTQSMLVQQIFVFKKKKNHSEFHENQIHSTDRETDMSPHMAFFFYFIKLTKNK